jgi:hypothetical protein
MHFAVERDLEEVRVRLSDHRHEAQVLGVIRHTTRKSRGRASLARTPMLEVISSPLANR